MADARATFRKPFAQGLAALRLRFGDLIPTERWDDIPQVAHDRGFMVAGAMKADLLADLAAAVDRIRSEGITFEAFKADFLAIAEKHGWKGWTGQGTEKGERWRARVIYRTNMLTSRAAGRRAQLIDGEYRFWVYRHSGAEHPRLHHLEWDGLALPPDHPFWATHSPPNGWGCGCFIRGAYTDAGIRRAGGDPSKQLAEGWDAPDPATGTPPGIDKGWDHAPGASVADEIADTVRSLGNKLPKLPAEIGAAMFHAWPARAHAALDPEFRQFVDRALSAHVRQEYMIVGALKPRWIAAAKTRGLKIESAEIAVTDKNIQHTFRGTAHITVGSTRMVNRQPKAAPLDLDWYRDLPSHLRRPRAVLIDQTQRDPVFLLIYDVPNSMAKLVVEINTPVKKAGAIMNTVQTGRFVDANDLAADLGRGAVLVEGRL